MPPVSVSLTQFPSPGEAFILHAGDTVTFRLKLSAPVKGRAFLRTNLRHAARRRAEIIAEVERGIPPRGLDWEDVPMESKGPLEWSITLPLPDPGVFEARAGLLPEDGSTPLWPEAQGNARVKVEPAWTVTGNSVYAVFPRLYTAADAGGAALHPRRATPFSNEQLAPLDNAGYTVIPPSGTFRQVLARLDHILTDMKFRVVLLLPPFPVPTTHARMGRYGSPFAALDFYTVDPALAEFDRRATPLQQFQELVDGIHARGGRAFIDIPINHTGWASRLLAEHPEWFARDADDSFHSPGAWGVVWADLVKLNYDHRALWREMADVFLFWCRQGVDGFRCDAGYFIPAPVWAYITAKVREEFPDTVFLLEGLGGPIPVMLELLNKSGLNWAYSELFQNESRAAMDWYLPQAIQQSRCDGYQINFAETHDNNRLASVSPAWARLRTAVAALCSPAGGWGVTCGVEWFATEKIDVHDFSPLNEGAAENQIGEIKALQTLLEGHPAFAAGATLELVTASHTPAVALRRVAARDAGSVLALMNLDAEHPHEVAWRRDAFPLPEDGAATCLLSGRAVRLEAREDLLVLTLQPGQTVCLDGGAKTGDFTLPWEKEPGGTPRARAILQKAAALAQRLERALGVFRCDSDDDFLSKARRLLTNPAVFCQEVSGLPFRPVTEVHWPRDRRRVAVWPQGDFLLVTAEVAFCYSAETEEPRPRVLGRGFSLPGPSGHFALIPRPVAGDCRAVVQIHAAGHAEHPRGVLPVYLPGPLKVPEPKADGAAVRRDPDAHVVLTNGTGAMCHVRAAWGEVRSQYDALLAANPHPDFPVDRRMLLNRCRLWVVRRGFWAEVNADWLENVALLSENSARWEFNLPCGDGHLVRFAATVALTPGENQVTLTFHRLPGDHAGPVRLILRPDVEDRGFHDKWTLDDAAMRALDAVLTVEADAFAMPCHHGKLFVRMRDGAFFRQPERLEVEHPIDASRGLGSRSVLFSPGYFEIALNAPGDAARLTAALLTNNQPLPPKDVAPPETAGPFTPRSAARQFIVKRDDALTVIAGYPWFLDWGRDTLICLRGIAAAGEPQAVRGILKTFARFEKQGTLPNMIRGDDDSNRDTSDAPLWFFAAVADLLEREKSDAFLDETAGGRTIREVLVSIGRHCAGRLFNGIYMDPESGLLFSPAHFTWMDTNHPAGTPREGYPICIQSLWFAALKLLARIDAGDPRWAELAAKVQTSILKYFVRPGQAFLSDCLHAAPGTPAALAVADDHLRPNQLLAVTLGAVTDPEVCREIIESGMELLVPGALRTLADRPVNYELPVYRDGRLLNDPKHPFSPQYLGDEDTQRKPAYHNGTGWPWLMPMLAEAMLLTWGEAARERAAGVLASSLPLFRRFALGTLEECVDGATPHAPRACGAQAWSITEWLRVAALVRPEVLG